MAHLSEYIQQALTASASDIHLAAEEPPRFRVDGDLVALNQTRITGAELEQMLFEILSPNERDTVVALKNLDKSYCIEELGNFRLNIFYNRNGICAVIRVIASQIPSLDEISLPEGARQLLQAKQGLVLVTGPTGSGKSTTLASMIDYLNSNYPYHIITAEDPIEYIHPSKKALVSQREIGNSCLSFADALKYALREDPDVILVGEMRDLETIGLALTAAETGHLVFGTLHTRGAANSVDRIVDSFPTDQQAIIRTMLAESLLGVISQVLLKRKGRAGRVAAFEIMINNHAISNLIRKNKTFQITTTMQTSKSEGMLSMDHHLLELFKNEMISEESARSSLSEPAVLDSMLKRPAAAVMRPAQAVAPTVEPKQEDSKPMPFKPKPLVTESSGIKPATPPTLPNVSDAANRKKSG